MPKVILPLSLLFAVGLIQTAAAACEGSTRPSIHVIAEPAPVSVAADFSLSEISHLAHRAGEPHERAPMGFYISTVLHRVSMQVEPGITTTCAENLQIELTIQLTSRRIEIGREIQRQPCRYRTVLRHYQKKAMADNEAFADYVNTVATTLRNTPMPMISGRHFSRRGPPPTGAVGEEGCGSEPSVTAKGTPRGISGG